MYILGSRTLYMSCQAGPGLEPGPSALKASTLPIELTWQTSTVNTKNRQHFHTKHIANQNVANINKQDKLDCSDKQYNIGNELDIVKYSSLVYMLNKHRKLFVDDIRNLKQTDILQATFNTGHIQQIKQRPYKTHLLYRLT